MKLSNYTHWIEIMNGEYALFNSILMQIIFVDEKKLERIKKFNINNEEKQQLLELGIYVKNDSILNDVYDDLSNAIKKQSKQLSIMYLNISTYCNLACKYCFIENNPITNNCFQKMDFTTAKIAVDKFVGEINRNNIDEAQIIIYGGEPLTNFELLQKIIQYIRKIKYDLAVTIITNGTLLREKEALFLKQNKIGIGISLDGPKKINDKNRVFRGSNDSVYDSAIKGIKILNKYNCNYCVSATVTNDVLNNQEKVFSWIKGLKIKNIFWNLYHYSSYVDEKEWEKFYKKMSNFILNMYTRLDTIGVDEERVKEQLKLFLDKKFKFHNCGAVGLNQITVQPNGNVCICQGDSRSSDTIVGNIITDDISTILSNSKNNKWLEMYTIDRSECKKCPAISVCGGGCPLQSEALFGDRKELDKATCIYYKESLRWLLLQYYLAAEEVEKDKLSEKTV
jgi:uncharacterized protein